MTTPRMCKFCDDKSSNYPIVQLNPAGVLHRWKPKPPWRHHGYRLTHPITICGFHFGRGEAE